MIDHTIYRQGPRQKTAGLCLQFFIGAIGIGIMLALPARASESQAPWECSTYTGDAHTRCVETFAEWQRDQIAALEGKLRAQQETVNFLTHQLDRQASTNAELQRQLAHPPAVMQMAPPLYPYPSVGLSFFLGNPWIYGSPFFDRPYLFGPPYYYGPRYWGHRW